MRLLNGSNSRIYKLAWEDGLPIIVIATDGGLLEKPVKRDYVILGPGERIELWADFSEHRIGSEVRLISLPFTAGSGGMMGDMMGGMGGMMGFSGLYLRIFPHKSVTATAEETRMGTGKGDVAYWTAVVKPGTVLFEVGGTPEDVAKTCFNRMSHKLPVKVKMLKRREAL